MENCKLESFKNIKIAVIGQGYVGLPVAVAFAKYFPVLGFDIDKQRVGELKRNIDSTREVLSSTLEEVSRFSKDSNCTLGYQVTSNLEDIVGFDVFIVTVPTPIDVFKAPNLIPLKTATRMLGQVIKKDAIVIFESTVFPGCTEEICVPILEQISGLVYNEEFFVGYSPERINPGDKKNTLETIVKVTSGSTPEIAKIIDELYKVVVKAGTHLAPSIKVAEASKAIENAQRDLNISFMNELALICDKVGIDTNDVIDAASTKWNFLKYKPGLVGGHCIGVDPYYLVHKSLSLGYHPQVILSGRMVNDKMGAFVAGKIVKLMIEKEKKIRGSKALILGITFKENCSDVRNTRVVDIYHELISYGMKVDIYDPWANKDQVLKEHNLPLLNKLDASEAYDSVVLAVAHQEFLTFDFKKIKDNDGVVFDTKGFLDRSLVDGRL